MSVSGFEISGWTGPRRWLVPLLLFLALSTFAGHAQQSKVTDQNANVAKDGPAGVKEDTAAAANPMDFLGWFTGHWRAEAKAQNGNPPVQVDTYMKWAENRRALTFEVYFTTLGQKPSKKAEYYGMYFWDPQKKAARMYSVNSKGDLSVAEIRSEGDTFIQDTHVERMNGTTQEQHSIIVRDPDHNAWNWKVQLQKEGQWVDALQLRYVRVKDRATSEGGMR